MDRGVRGVFCLVSGKKLKLNRDGGEKTMKRNISSNGKYLTLLALAAAIMFWSAPGAFAQSAGSFAGDFNGGSTYIIPLVTCSVTNIGTCANAGTNFLDASIKMPTGKSLLIMGSLETALYTDTSTSSKSGTKSTSSADASIIVTPVLTDQSGNVFPVYPSTVTFDSRLQTLTATFDGTNCTADLTTGVVTCSSPETVGLLLSTMSAHSFNFIAPYLAQGVYTLNFNIAASTTGSADTIGNSVSVKAGVRAGSLGLMVVQTQTPFSSLSFTP